MRRGTERRLRAAALATWAMASALPAGAGDAGDVADTRRDDAVRTLGARALPPAEAVVGMLPSPAARAAERSRLRNPALGGLAGFPEPGAPPVLDGVRIGSEIGLLDRLGPGGLSLGGRVMIDVRRRGATLGITFSF